MENSQVTFIVIFISGLLLIIAFFFWLVLITQRYRANRLYQEKEAMQLSFDRQQLESRLETQETTFAEISRELHDNVGQILSLTKLQLNLMDQGTNIDREMLLQAREGISRAMADLRDIAKGLDGDRIRDTGFEEVITREADRISRTGFFNVAVTSRGTTHQLPGQKKLSLFRTIQELLQNIIKHACADSVTISLDYGPEKLELAVCDNGKGFDPALASNGAGLVNIQKRSAHIGATILIDSTIGQGTRIKIIIPYE